MSFVRGYCLRVTSSGGRTPSSPVDLHALNEISDLTSFMVDVTRQRGQGGRSHLDRRSDSSSIMTDKPPCHIALGRGGLKARSVLSRLLLRQRQ